MTTKPPAATIGKFLRDNGMSLGALTGQDWPALRAATEIMALFNRCDPDAEAHALTAFRCVVMTMQASTRYLAYHAIAHVCDWPARAVVWERAALPPFERAPPRCKYE